MDGGDYASIIAGIIAALSAWAVSRSAGKANKRTKELETQAAVEAERVRLEGVKETTRSQAETDAYERARSFDIATIERQTAEILQVRADNIHLNADVKRVNSENQELFIEREALRNEIRVMHEERAREREACYRNRVDLARAIAAGRMDLDQIVKMDTHDAKRNVIEASRRSLEIETHDRPIVVEIEDHVDSVDYTDPGNDSPDQTKGEQ